MSQAKRIILGAFLASFLAIFGNLDLASAASLEESSEFQKALATSLSACYARGAFKDEINLASYGTSGSIKSIMSSTNVAMSAPIPYGYTTSSVQLPTMSCSDIMSRALSKKGLSIPAKFEDAGSVLTKIGYTKTTSRDLDNEKTCFWFEYDVNVDDIEWIQGGGDYRTRNEVWRSKQVCLTEYTDSGKAMTRLESVNADNGGNSKILNIKKGNGSIVEFQTQSFGVNDDWIYLDAHRVGTAEDFMLGMYNAIIATKHGRNGSGEVGSGINHYTLKGYEDQTSPVGSAVASATYYLQAGAAGTVPEDLFGVTRLFDQTNTFIMYQNYLMKFYGAMTLQINSNDPTQESLRTGNDKDLGGYSKVKVYNNGKVEECYVKPKKSSGKLYGVSNNRFGGIDATSWQYPSPVFQVSYDEIIRFLNSASPSGSQLKSNSNYIVDASCASDSNQEQTKPSNPGGSGSTDPDNDDDPGGGVDVSQCIESARPLGWILCPVLDMASEATSELYSYIENRFLWIGSDVMGSNTDTHEAWKTFRDYANVAFIIVFLVVILSQITGFGISNYGVKKILPRLIAVALLTNLSFIICQLAVDLSDILGAGLKDALIGIGGVTDASAATYGVNAIVNDARVALFGTGATALIMAGVTWKIWLLPLLLAIVGALAGVFMFFLSLAVREAGIIILVVLCPVAIVCYALPNTKKLFDKWFRMFTSLLMVYPICGLLMGGGQFASGLLVRLSNDPNVNFMFLLTAMLLSVVPFFFIPTLVRTSLNVIGQLGARLSNFGRGMSGRLVGGIRGSEGFRNRQQELAARRDEATVKRLDFLGRARKAVGLREYTRSGQRKRAAAYARADKYRQGELIGQSYNGRGLLKSDSGRQKQLLGNLKERDFMERVKGAKAIFSDDPSMATEGAIVAKHDQLLEQFGEDPTNLGLQTQLRALEEMAIGKGAPGQDLLQQSFAKYMTDHKKSWSTKNASAISKLSAGLAANYGKELNGSDKSFNTMVNKFAEGDFGNLDSFKYQKGVGYRSDFDMKNAGFAAAGLGKATPGALERAYASLAAGDFSKATDPDKRKKDMAAALAMVTNANQALDDGLIAHDLKAAEKGFIQDIASYGASMPGHASIVTGLGGDSLANIANFVDTTNDTGALMSLGKNIQDAASSSHLYNESETQQLRMIINKINSRAGTSYAFNPASMQIDQGDSSSRIITGNEAEE